MKIWQWPRDRALVNKHFDNVDETPKAVEEAVDAIIAEVRRRGDRAICEYTKKFDKVTLKPEQFEVAPEAMEAAWDAADPKLKRALRTAKRRITAFHKTQKLKGWKIREKGFGTLEQRVLPMERVAVYVPAGEAPLVSTVLMDTIPAKVAGVKEIILLSPPQADGSIDPGILAAAHLAGVDRAFAVGSAWAVAAVAYGTGTIPRVDKVVGPGNPYVTTAKQRLYGRIDIESVAGPSEVLVLADRSAPLKYIAADLLAQAEHSGDNPTGVVLIGGGERRAQELRDEVYRQIRELTRGEMAKRSIDNHGYIICVRTTSQAIELANRKAPEHLEIICEEGEAMVKEIVNASAIFLGPWTPEPVGDYIAGPNHTLPTGGTSRFFSPLSVWSFYKTSHVISASKQGLATLADQIITLAESEWLTAHANSVRVRKEDIDK